MPRQPFVCVCPAAPDFAFYSLFQSNARAGLCCPMTEPHDVPLPPSRGSLDSVRDSGGGGGAHRATASTLRNGPSALEAVDEGGTDAAGDAGWFEEQTQPPEDAEGPAEGPPEGETEDPDQQQHHRDATSGDDQDPANGEVSPDEGDMDERTRALEDELERTRADRDAWEEQYQGLLAKLTTMRNTVGDKLRQDAVRSPVTEPSTVPRADSVDTAG